VRRKNLLKRQSCAPQPSVGQEETAALCLCQLSKSTEARSEILQRPFQLHPFSPRLLQICKSHKSKTKLQAQSQVQIWRNYKLHGFAEWKLHLGGWGVLRDSPQPGGPFRFPLDSGETTPLHQPTSGYGVLCTLINRHSDKGCKPPKRESSFMHVVRLCLTFFFTLHTC
jgi:hypothetical protein